MLYCSMKESSCLQFIFNLVIKIVCVYYHGVVVSKLRYWGMSYSLWYVIARIINYILAEINLICFRQEYLWRNCRAAKLYLVKVHSATDCWENHPSHTCLYSELVQLQEAAFTSPQLHKTIKSQLLSFRYEFHLQNLTSTSEYQKSAVSQ